MSSGTLVTILICVVIAVIAVVAIISYVKKLNSGCCGTGGNGKIKKIKPKDTDIKNFPYKRTIVIDGMSCKNCENHIANEFNKNDNFLAMVSLESGQAIVYSKTEVSDNQLKNIVNQAGYTAIRCE